MKEVPFSSSLSSRKNELHRQIVEAVELNDKKQFSLLEFKWAHRYGLQTMPKILNSQSFFESAKDSNHVPQDFRRDSIDLAYHQEALSPLLCSVDSERNSIGTVESISPKGSRGLSCDYSEDINNDKDSQSIQVRDNEMNNKNNSQINFPPPPRPALNHFRSWLPVSEEDIPKAS